MNANPPKKPIGIKEVAKYAQVSISTVSNVLNGTKTVSDELRERVMNAVNALGYETNMIARGLKSGKTNNIAVIVSSINSIFFPALLNSIQTAAEEKNYTISVFGTHSSLDQEKKYIQLLKSQWVDGILLSSSLDTESPKAQEYIHMLTSLNTNGHSIPVVCLEAAISDMLDAVVVNDTAGIKTAAEHLIAVGKKNIGYIAAPFQFTMGKLRKAGYINALEEHHYPVNERLIAEGDYSPVSGYRCMQKLLQTHLPLDGVVAGNDQMAIGAMRAIMEAGLKIPEDIAVIGFNDNFPSSLITPSLSTIRVPKEEMGTMAFNLLMRRMENLSASRMLINLDGKLIIRNSTDPKAETAWDMNW